MKLTVSCLLILGLNVVPTPGLATDRRVPEDFPDVQAALDAADTGDRVLVGAGVYVGGIDFAGKDVRLESTDGPATTIIDGNGSTGVQIGPFGAIEGFTIRNSVASFGAGMVVSGFGSQIRGNVFDSNHQDSGGFGAGIGGNSASPIIDGNLFRNNSCDDQFLSGVVSFVNSSSPTIVNNVFVSNDCRGINMTLPVGNNPSVTNNSFVGNRVAIRVDARIPTAGQSYRNNLIAQNGTGLEVDFGSAGNNPVWENNLVFGNTIDYDGIDDLTGALGNIAEDPQLADVAGADLHLLAGSPAIDSGSETLAPVTDFDGNPRPFDGDGDGSPRTDIGAFESGEPAPPLDVRIEVEARRGGRIDLRRHLIRVTLFSGAGFDVRTNDQNGFAFGPLESTPRGSFFHDVDRDAADDLVLFFDTAATGLTKDVPEACLAGSTLQGREFRACDAVRVFDGQGGRPFFDGLWRQLRIILAR